MSDLNNKTIAIEAKQSASSGRVSAALMAVGAADVQFSEGQRGAIERLISGEVPAAVVTLISPEAAEWFPDIPGFRTFRVPLGDEGAILVATGPFAFDKKPAGLMRRRAGLVRSSS